MGKLGKLGKLGKWIKKRKTSDWLFILIVLFTLLMRGPSLLEQFRQQGQVLTPIVIDEKLFPPAGEKSVLVFWASWCGPCTIELNRIQSAIEKKEISLTHIYAVNLGESRDVVNKATIDRKFKLPVILDDRGELANLLNVKVTPTIVFVDEEGKINWISSGLSPSLIYRIKYFLKN
ncbi:MAG: TlpA disulfide reductase family protein [Bacteriovorax sp.]|nr:TlpA disulfide reductase family protein [Bacteriovorax sp.]